MRPAAILLISFACAGALGFGAPAHAQSQLLIGLRGGATGPTSLEWPFGPALGIDVTARLARLVAAELTFEQSLHQAQVLQGAPSPAWMSVWTLGLQYRLDVTWLVPYATLAVEGRRIAAPRLGEQWGYGAAFAVGLMAPLSRHFFWGVEARYGIGNDGAFPTRQTYVARFGWRNLDF